MILNTLLNIGYYVRIRMEESYLGRFMSYESLTKNSQLTRLTVLCMEGPLSATAWIEIGEMKTM